MKKYIEVEAAKEFVRMNNRICKEENGNKNGTLFALLDSFEQFFEEAIDEAPEADVVGLRHSRWILDTSSNGEFICWCEKCGCGVKDQNTDRYINISDAPFCPHCGARMDGKVDMRDEK